MNARACVYVRVCFALALSGFCFLYARNIAQWVCYWTHLHRNATTFIFPSRVLLLWLMPRQTSRVSVYRRDSDELYVTNIAIIGYIVTCLERDGDNSFLI